MTEVIDRNSLAALRQVIANTTARLKPRERLTVSEHATRYRYVGAATSHYAGPWRNELTPHLVEIMDAANEEGVHTIVLMGPAQAAKTEAILNWIAYFMHWEPCPIIMVMPDDSLVETFSNMRLMPMIRESPALAKLIETTSKRNSRNKITEKAFPMGSIFIGSGETAKTYVQRAARVAIMDDTDQVAQDIKGQGSPDSLLDKRTETYATKALKIYCGNPTNESSHMARLWRKGDRRASRLPCPFCSHMQSLKFERFVFKEIDRAVLPGTVFYPCEKCGELIPESKADWMRQGIKYEAARKTRGIASFWIEGGAFDAGWKPWHKILDEIIKAKENQEEYKTVWNVTLARVWQTTKSAPPWEELYERKKTFRRGEIPKGALCLTLGVDVQHDRLEGLLVGWGRKRQRYVIDHFMWTGNPALPSTWDGLRNLITSPMPAPLICTAIDSGDGNTVTHVYDFVQSMRQGDERVIATKGASRYLPTYVLPPEALEIRVDGKRKQSGGKVYSVGTDFIKSEIYAFFKLPHAAGDKGQPPGWIFFADGFSEEFYQQCTAESLTMKIVGAKRRWYWQKTRERNEGLDLLVLNTAAVATKGWMGWTENDWQKWEQARAMFAQKPQAVIGGAPAAPRRSAAENYGGISLD